MALFQSKSAIWEEIDVAESFLVCSMFEEAVSKANLIVQNLQGNCVAEAIEECEFSDMLESAGMVLVQSLKELGRIADIFGELEIAFGSIPAIPGQVFLTGVCMQIAAGFTSDLKLTLEHFLSAWKLVAEESPVFMCLASDQSIKNGTNHPILSTEIYLKIVDLYVTEILVKLLHEIGLAVSWIEKAKIPEEKCQELLRKVHSLSSTKDSSSSSVHDMPQQQHSSSICASEKDHNESNLEAYHDSGKNRKSFCKNYSQTTILQALHRHFCWYPILHLKHGNAKVTLQLKKFILWGMLVLSIAYILRKKRVTLRNFASRQASVLGRAIVDAWNLAFSVQVNPLAAVQPLPGLSHGSR